MPIESAEYLNYLEQKREFLEAFVKNRHEIETTMRLHEMAQKEELN